MKLITPSPVSFPMIVFLDFEASSLAKLSYPIEVAWVFEDGASESYLIRPAAQWTDWDAESEAIHNIPRELLERDGIHHEVVAQRMVEQLSGHTLFASAPSWDGKWLSALLRAAKLPRHALRVRDTDEARAEAARRILSPVVRPDRLHIAIGELLTLADTRHEEGEPTHRALPDALAEQRRWSAIVAAAEDLARNVVRD